MNFRLPGALCQELGASHDLEDGTTARTVAPKPGAVGGGQAGDGGHLFKALLKAVCAPAANAAVQKALPLKAAAKEKAKVAPAKPESPPKVAGVAHVLTAPETYLENADFANPKGNHECVEFAKQAGGAPQTALWRKGAHVEPGQTPPLGTWVATFVNEKYEGHVGAFDSMDASGNLTLYDQWNDKGKVSKTTYHVKPKDYTGRISNDPSKYYVVLW